MNSFNLSFGKNGVIFEISEAEYHYFRSYLSNKVQLSPVKNKKPLISEWSVIVGAGLEAAASGHRV